VVGIRGWRLSRGEAIGAGSEGNGAVGDRLTDALPSVDRAQGDLAEGAQRPDRYRHGLSRGQFCVVMRRVHSS
jgi:hypothetical protein